MTDLYQGINKFLYSADVFMEHFLEGIVPIRVKLLKT